MFVLPETNRRLRTSIYRHNILFVTFTERKLSFSFTTGQNLFFSRLSIISHFKLQHTILSHNKYVYLYIYITYKCIYKYIGIHYVLLDWQALWRTVFTADFWHHLYWALLHCRNTVSRRILCQLLFPLYLYLSRGRRRRREPVTFPMLAQILIELQRISSRPVSVNWCSIT